MLLPMKHLATLLLSLLVSGGLWADDDILNLNCVLEGEHDFYLTSLDVKIDFKEQTVDGLMAAKGREWFYSQLSLTKVTENSYEFQSQPINNEAMNLLGLSVLNYNLQARYILNRSNGLLNAQIFKDQNGYWQKNHQSDYFKSSFSAYCAEVSTEKLF